MSIDVLQERIRKLKCPIMVGLDPYLPILPRHIVRDAFDEYGQTLRGAAEAYYRFCTELLDRLSPIVFTPVDDKHDFAYMVLPVRLH